MDRNTMFKFIIIFFICILNLILYVHLWNANSCFKNKCFEMTIFSMGNSSPLLPYHLPMSVPDAGVTDGVKDGQVLLELVHLVLDSVGHTAGPCLVTELLGQLVHGPPHVSHLVLYLLRVQVLEWSYNKQTLLMFNLVTQQNKLKIQSFYISLPAK